MINYTLQPHFFLFKTYDFSKVVLDSEVGKYFCITFRREYKEEGFSNVKFNQYSSLGFSFLITPIKSPKPKNKGSNDPYSGTYTDFPIDEAKKC